MSKEKKLIPDLRFPEFDNEGEWQIKEVGEIFDVTRGYVLAMSSVQEKKSDENPYPVFSSQTKNNGLAGFFKDYLYEDAITWTTDGANAGDVNYREGKFYCTNVCGVLINKKGYANKCISELINSVSKKYVSYVGNPKLMNGVMSQIKIPIPLVKEQQRIASCLSSIDEVIAAHILKLDLLKDHKKGLMQNLFPKDGEKVPKYRFKDFEKDGEWKIKEFGDLINILSDYTANGSFASLKENVTYYSSLEYAVLVRTTDLDKKIFTPQRFTDKRGYEFLSKTSLFGNEIVMANVGSIGKVFRVPYYDRPMTLAPNTYVLKFNDFVDEDFVYQLMLRTEFEHKLLSMVGSSTLMAINKSNLRSIKVSIPKKDEQQKIAKCLSSLDALINAQDEKIEQLKWHKKGLMQGLFPKFQD